MKLPLIFLFLPLLFAERCPASDSQKIPPVLHTLKSAGVNLKFVKTVHGLHVWKAQKEGKSRLLYVTPNQEALLLGDLYDVSGSLNSWLGEADFSFGTAYPQPAHRVQEFWRELESSPWFKIGSEKAPVVYFIADPSCGHCLKMVERLLPYTESAQLQIRVILVSFLGEKSEQAASFILAAQNPAQAFLDYKKNPRLLDTSSAFSAKTLRHRDENNGLLIKWGISSTPLSVFKDTSNNVKVIEGALQNVESLLKILKP
jgi:thiol:disulfide interchange protein DsbG